MKKKKCENVKTEITCDLDPLSIDPSALIWIRIKYGSSGIKEYQSHHQRISPHSASSYQKASNYQLERVLLANDSLARGSLSGLSSFLTQPPSAFSRRR